MNGNKHELDTIDVAAVDVAVSVAADRSIDLLRGQMGDVATGAHVAAGLTIEDSTSLASRVHCDPSQRERIRQSGGLYVGAEIALRGTLEPVNG